MWVSNLMSQAPSKSETGLTVAKKAVPQRIESLTAFRGLACLIVLASHFCNEWGLPIFKGTGQLGVALFFVLSGFLMHFLYFGSDFHARWEDFSRARIGRLYPLLVLVVCLIFFFGPFNLDEDWELSNWTQLLFNIVPIQGSGVLWTIVVELQFYLIFLALWAAPKRSILLWLAFALSLLDPGILRKISIGDQATVVFYLPNVIAYFLAGMVLSRLHQLVDRRGGISKEGSWVITSLGALVLILCFPVSIKALDHMLELGNFGRGSPWMNLDRYWVLFWCMLGFWLILREDILQHVKGLVVLGEVSYAAYVFHYPVILFLKQYQTLADNAFLAIVPFLLITLLLSQLSTFYFESPLRRIIRGKFKYRESVTGGQ